MVDGKKKQKEKKYLYEKPSFGTNQFLCFIHFPLRHGLGEFPTELMALK